MVFDVVIVGGGHAGAEAAWAASKLGLRAALVTLDPSRIAQMSCNPAIGGLAKGQMVREIDALGGLMGLATDATAIQFRMLNRSKGPAVWGPRAQADKYRYAAEVQRLLGGCSNLTIVAGEAVRIEAAADGDVRRVSAVELAGGERIACRAVVVTTGTFLRGLMHTGLEQRPGGRFGEPAAGALSDSLRELGLELARLKTGTPPRLDVRSVDLAQLELQPGDAEPLPFSHMNEYRGDWTPALRQVPCHLTATNEAVHEMIRQNLHRAPLYSGQIQSVGPRYCPSIEDKVVRFAEQQQHHVFLEPEGLDTPELYCNGISTSLPADVQEKMVRGIKGLEGARFIRYGYAIEYDMAPPTQIRTTLETKAVRGLFLAGQINGTSGYEEAAAQGLVAGVNAAQWARQGECSFILRRDQAYIGVMIDDLITKPPSEPYRMFTSRAEHRLHLRSDNADQRLTEVGRQVGLVDAARWQAYEEKRRAVETAKLLLAEERVGGMSAAEFLRRPETDWNDLVAAVPAAGSLRADAARAVTVQVKYEGYISRQDRLVQRLATLEQKAIPCGIDYASVTGLRNEARQKLAKHGPHSLGQALRISGITPADIMVLAIHLQRPNRAAGVAEPTGMS
jgi:tRNA uridine 5-carboxymethylaminomethyl modification enzyme